MRSLRLWHRVGPPTWKRSGTLIFVAVMGVLLVGGTAMAANLGLLTSPAARDRSYRLDVPRPPLAVTLPGPELPSSTPDTTSDPEDEDGTADGDDDDQTADPEGTVASTVPEHRVSENPDYDDEDDADSGDDDSGSKRETNDSASHRDQVGERTDTGASRVRGDGMLDDD